MERIMMKITHYRSSLPATALLTEFTKLIVYKPEIIFIERTQRRYAKDDKYSSHCEDIDAFFNREIAKSIIRGRAVHRWGNETDMRKTTHFLC
jgi:hypothetical protein